MQSMMVKGILASVVKRPKSSSDCTAIDEISVAEKKKKDMFVIVSTYLAKVGEEDSIIALHEDWQRNHASTAKNHVSWELLRKIEAPREFIAIAHYESEELAKIAENNLEQDAWLYRFMSLIEESPISIHYTSEWRLQ